ncbi:hypothetical protein H0H87_008451 [Tephrocybe sp. NHM501043]|nr:hypothetical protein H0H87_008451 [Tephrocybe sp. NHM501043]
MSGSSLTIPKEKTEKIKNSKRPSASVFAEEDLEIGDKKASTMSFIIERGAVPLILGHYKWKIASAKRFPEDTVSTDVLEEINAMFRLYVQFVEFQWPANWKTLENLPSVREDLKHCLKTLYQQMQEYKGDNFPVTSEERTKPWANILKLPNDVDLSIDEKHLTDVLPLFLQIGAAAIDMNNAIKRGLSVIEAETRQNWDNICAVVFGLRDIGDSPYMLLERVLGSPQEAICRTSEKALHRHLDYIAHIRELEVSSLSSDLMKALRQEAAITCQGKFDLSSHITQKEPIAMKTDAIIVATCPPDKPFTGTHTKVNAISLVHARGQPTAGKNSQLPGLAAELEDNSQSTDTPALASGRSGIRHGLRSANSLKKAEQGPRLVVPLVPAVASIPSDLSQSLGHPLDNKRLYNYKSIPSLPANVTRTSPNDLEKGYLLMPFCVIEHKKSDKTKQQALNQVRLYAISTAKFYATLGVEEAIPIFGIVTYGTEASVTLTWSSIAAGKHLKSFMFEQEIQSFDISQPLDCYRFSTFLIGFVYLDRNCRASSG